MERPYNSLDVSGLAKLFAPPSIQDIYAGTQAQALRQKMGMQQSLWDAASAPGATLPGLDTRAVAAGLYNPSQSAWSVQQNNQRQLQENTANNQTSITKEAMGPLSQGQTRYLPPAVAKALGMPGQQFGVQNVSQGSTLTLPDARGGIQGDTDDGTNPNKTISGGDAPLTLDQQKAKDYATMDPSLRQAMVFGNTPVEAVLGPGGQPTNVTRPQSIGQQPVPDAQKMPEIAQLQAYRDSLAAKVGPNDPRVKEVDAAIAAKGRGMTPDPTQAEVAKGRGSRINEAIDAGKAASAMAGDLNVLEQAISHASPNTVFGPGSEQWLQTKQILSNVFGEMPGTADAELIRNIGTKIATMATKELTSRPALLEFSTMIANKPGLMMTPQGNQFVISIMKQKAEKDMALADLARDPANQANWDQVEGNFLRSHPLVSPFTGKPVGPQDMQVLQQAAGGAPAVAPAGGAPIRVNTPEEAMRLPPGTQFVTPDGRVKVR